jgi:hypothetical protein
VKAQKFLNFLVKQFTLRPTFDDWIRISFWVAHATIYGTEAEAGEEKEEASANSKNQEKQHFTRPCFFVVVGLS